MTKTTESVQLNGVTKVFYDQAKKRAITAVNNVSLIMPAGQFTTLLGPSGCGKTTILRMIAGFEQPTGGTVYIGSRPVNDVPPQMRDTAMVFQSYAIFPHLTVFDNIAYGLKIKKLPRAEIRAKVEWALDLMRMTEYRDREPRQLSGGQQQRVALARALVMEPKVLLFDEPLSNLDAKLRVHMREEIRKIQQRLGVTAIYVTHDQAEAMSMSDQIVVMNSGVVEQVGTPEEIYRQPATRFVADFVGKANFIPCRIVEQGQPHLEILGRKLPFANAARLPDRQFTAVVRPEHIMLGRGCWQAVVKRKIYLGTHTEYILDVDGFDLAAADLAAGKSAAEGATVTFDLAAEAIHILP